MYFYCIVVEMSGNVPKNRVLVTPLYKTKGLEGSEGFNSFRVNFLVNRDKNGNSKFVWKQNPTSNNERVGKYVNATSGGYRKKYNRSQRRRSRRNRSRRNRRTCRQ